MRCAALFVAASLTSFSCGVAHAESTPPAPLALAGEQSPAEIVWSLWTRQTRLRILRAFREHAPRVAKGAPTVNAALVLHLAPDRQPSALELMLPKDGPPEALFAAALTHVRALLPKLPPAPALDLGRPLVRKVVLRFSTSLSAQHGGQRPRTTNVE